MPGDVKTVSLIIHLYYCYFPWPAHSNASKQQPILRHSTSSTTGYLIIINPVGRWSGKVHVIKAGNGRILPGLTVYPYIASLTFHVTFAIVLLKVFLPSSFSDMYTLLLAFNGCTFGAKFFINELSTGSWLRSRKVFPFFRRGRDPALCRKRWNKSKVIYILHTYFL